MDAKRLVHSNDGDLFLDFPLHHDDGRPHFWPLSCSVYESPVSFWGRTHGTEIPALIAAGVASVAPIALWRQKLGVAMTVFVAYLRPAELWVVRQRLFYFIEA